MQAPMQKNSKKLSTRRVSNAPEMRDALRLLKRGGVGVLLTDTIYGLVGSALQKKTVERMYRIKGRTETKPFIILIASLQDLARFGMKLSPLQNRALAKLWKAKRPTSIILPVRNKKFAYLHRGSESIAFRLPQVTTLRRLIQKSGPLVAPSANPQSKEPAVSISEAEYYFGKKVDFYVDGGIKRGKPSRLIRVNDSGAFEVLRK